MPADTPHGFSCANIARIVGNYSFEIGDGYTTSNDAEVILFDDPATVVGPDVAFYRGVKTACEIPERWGDKVPTLAVEVLSPNDRWTRVPTRRESKPEFRTHPRRGRRTAEFDSVPRRGVCQRRKNHRELFVPNRQRLRRQQRFRCDTLNEPDTVVGPNVAYFTVAARFDDMHPKWGEAVPALAVEVLSPSDKLRKIMAKIEDYLQSGVAAVWLVDYEERFVTVFRSTAIPRTFGATDSISVDDYLPGFACAVADFFRIPGESPSVS